MTLKTTAYKKLFLFEKKKPDETVKTFYPKKGRNPSKKSLKKLKNFETCFCWFKVSILFF